MSDQTEFAVQAVQVASQRHNLEGGARIDEDELRQLVEVSSELLAITDFDGYFQLLNPVWERVLGYSREELRSRPFLEFVHPDDRGKTETTADLIQPGLELLSFTNRYVAKDGAIKVLHWRAFVSTDTERYYASARDMTDELKSRERSAALDAICEIVPDAVVMQDADGVITRWDGGAEQVLGRPGSQALGRPLGDFLSLVSNGVGVDLIQLAEDGLDENVEAWFRLPEGEQVPVTLNIREFGDGASPVTGAVARIARA